MRACWRWRNRWALLEVLAHLSIRGPRLVESWIDFHFQPHPKYRPGCHFLCDSNGQEPRIWPGWVYHQLFQHVTASSAEPEWEVNGTQECVQEKWGKAHCTLGWQALAHSSELDEKKAEQLTILVMTLTNGKMQLLGVPQLASSSVENQVAAVHALLRLWVFPFTPLHPALVTYQKRLTCWSRSMDALS